MWSNLTLLVLGDGGGSDGLFYIIAVLILSALGAIVDKIKQKMGEKPGPPADRKPTPPVQRRGTPVPARPARRPPTQPAEPFPGGPPARPLIPDVAVEPKRRVRRPPPPRPVAGPPARPSGSPPVPRRRTPQPPRARPTRSVPPTEGSPTTITREAFEELRPFDPVASLVDPAIAGTQPRLRRGRKGSPVSFRQLDSNEWRRAIVLHEILGPPRAMRDLEQLW